MGSFRTNSRGGFGGRSGGSRFGGGSRDFGGRGGFGGRDSGRFERRPLEMHDATCDKCKKQCQVPFRPSGDKPVFCSNCFKNEGSGSSFGSRDRGRPSSSGMSSEQFKQINTKLDKIINALEIESNEDSDDKEEEDSEVDSGEDLSKDLSANSDEDSKDDSGDDLDDDSDDDSEDEPKTV